MKLQLIDQAGKWYSMYSIWFFALLGVMPELYNLAVSYNMVSGEAAPAVLARAINTIAFVGAVSRLIKQKKLALESESSDSATPT